MGALSSAMDWWEEWKLRILVLCSISIQFFLAFALNVRGLYCLRRLRVMVWIAYIGGDALAIYALATLFNRQTKQESTSALEVIWAPILLIHLGGQQLTAYSLEDNELWKRHVITLVSQITVALYVFCKWWSGERKLLVAAVLLFVVGILRFCQKPLALRWASYDTLASSPLSLPSVPTTYSQEEYVEKARQHVKERPPPDQAASDQGQGAQGQAAMDEMYLNNESVRVFLGGPTPYYIRLQRLCSFLKVGNGFEQHQKLSFWIQMHFLFTYTKLLSLLANNRLGVFLALGLRGLTLASVVLFAKSDKNGYNKSDVAVTYILFSATVVIEFGPDCFNLLFLFLRSLPLVWRVHGWSDMVSQYNIMQFSSRMKKTTMMKNKWMMKMMPATLVTKLDAASSYLKKCILFNSKHWYVWHVPAAEQISVLVRQHAEYGWKEYIRDPATYRIFNNLRGEHTLRKHHLLEQLRGTFDDFPFDACVLVWHLATDICLQVQPSGTESSSIQSQPGASSESRRNSEIISNHMIYLLFFCPEMLMPGTRPLWFTAACLQIEALIKDTDEPSSSSSSPLEATSHGSIARRICRVIEAGDQQDVAKRAELVFVAYKIAAFLITTLEEETERWDVIQGVWVEMLCYSASRSRAYEHAKSLAHGAEYLTSAWLIWSYMGMETFPDRMQLPGPPQPDPAAAEQQASAAAAEQQASPTAEQQASAAAAGQQASAAAAEQQASATAEQQASAAAAAQQASAAAAAQQASAAAASVI